MQALQSKRTAKKASYRADSPEQASARYWAGVNIYAARSGQKMTQAELAKKAKISIKTLYGIENVVPASNLTFETFESISRALGVSPQDLLKVNKKLWLRV
jgi:DNA-binding Xre family transcriptional regulator